MSYRIGVDIGGTFTDFALYGADSGTMAIHKLLTTQSDPSEAVLAGVGALLAEYESLTATVAENPDAKSLDRLQRVQDQISEEDAWDLQRVAAGQLRSLKLPPDAPFSTLSSRARAITQPAPAVTEAPPPPASVVVAIRGAALESN